MSTTTTQSLAEMADQGSTAADSTTTMRQIGQWTLRSCGARDFAADGAGLLQFRVGPNGKRVCKVLVRLMADYTYAVEYGRMTMNHRSPKFGIWEVVEQEFGIYGDMLAATVRRLGDRERY